MRAFFIDLIFKIVALVFEPYPLSFFAASMAA